MIGLHLLHLHLQILQLIIQLAAVILLLFDLLVIGLDSGDDSGGFFQLLRQVADQIILCLQLLHGYLTLLILSNLQAVLQSVVIVLQHLDMRLIRPQLLLRKGPIPLVFRLYLLDLLLELVDLKAVLFCLL